jgi:hypothetical protein
MEVTMFTSHPHDGLFVAHVRGRELRAEAASERLPTPGISRVVASFLRRVAERLDPAPRAPQTA